MANRARTITSQQSPAPTSAGTPISQIHKAGEPGAAVMPLQYGGGDLGLASDVEEPWIVIVDNAGTKWTTHSVEWVLRNIIHFTPRCQSRILADAAVHFGLGPSKFIRADFELDRSAVNASSAVMWSARLALGVTTSTGTIERMHIGLPRATEQEAMAEAEALAEQLGAAVLWFGTARIADQVAPEGGWN